MEIASEALKKCCPLLSKFTSFLRENTKTPRNQNPKCQGLSVFKRQKVAQSPVSLWPLPCQGMGNCSSDSPSDPGFPYPVMETRSSLVAAGCLSPWQASKISASHGCSQWEDLFLQLAWKGSAGVGSILGSFIEEGAYSMFLVPGQVGQPKGGREVCLGRE